MEPKYQLMHQKIILRVVSKYFIPMILLFGLYVQFHGDFGPGGGFQAGVIFAAGFILYGLIFGLGAMRKMAPPRVIEIGCAVGLLLYAGVGIASMFLGGNYLDYDVLNSHSPAHGQHIGILLIEAGVGITVTCTMIAIFDAMAGRFSR